MRITKIFKNTKKSPGEIFFWYERSSEKRRSKEKGQAVLIAVLFFVFISMSMILALLAPTLSHLKSSRSLHSSLEAFAVAESGMEDVVYRFKKGTEVEEEETTAVGAGEVRIFVLEGGGIGIAEEINIRTQGVMPGNIIRNLETRLILGDGMAFNYGVHAGDGGLNIVNPNAKVIGNVFSNGPISGGSGPKKQIEGSAISAGPEGLINNINVHVDAKSDIIEGSHVEGNAFYREIINTTVSGDMHPNTEPTEKGDLPISEEEIERWKNFAEESMVVSGDYVLTAGEESLGPAKIEGDLILSGHAKLKVTGTVWVTGNVEMSNQAELSLDDGTFGFTSGVIIGDGVIDLRDGATARGTSHGRSYLLLLSTFDGDAIIIGDDADIDVVYTSRGFVVLRDGVDLKSITGYGVRLQDNAVVTYEGGLADAFFSTGPGGGYSIFTWKEVE